MTNNIHWGGFLVSDCVEGVKILPNEIFQNVFSYLDLNSLKCARKVCQLWNTNVIPILKKKSTLKLLKLLNYRTCMHFFVTMENSAELPFEEFRISIESGCEFSTTREIFPRFGHSIKRLELIFECCGRNGNYKYSLSFEDLNFILQNMPNLNAFHITAEYDPYAAKDFLIPDGEVEYNSIKVLTIQEAYQEDLDTDFCISKQWLTMFAKLMPNIEKIGFVFCRQENVDDCIGQLVDIRKLGFLKSVTALKMDVQTVQNKNTVYFDQGHLSSLSDLKWSFETLELKNFHFSGCDKINRQDISAGAMWNFLSEISDSLKVLALNNVSGGRSMAQTEMLSNIPVMKNVKTLDLSSTVDLMPFADWTSNFPSLNVFCVRGGWNSCFNEAFPYLAHKKTTFNLTISQSTEGQTEFDRKIDFQLDALDYSFSNPDFFRVYFSSWFPNIKEIYTSVKVHFALYNLLLGLSNTNVEEIGIRVDCEICKNRPSVSWLQQLKEMKYIDDHLIHLYVLGKDLRNTTPFPRLRGLLILTDCCTEVSPKYFKISDIMNLLKAAPHLDYFEVSNAHPNPYYFCDEEISTI